MTTNIDRAAGIIRAMVKIENPTHDTDVAQALADATPPLLMSDLPEPDRDGFWWPEHGRNYGNVHVSPVYVRDMGQVVPMVTIARGGPGYASRYTSMTLTKDEALELASILTAAADYAERNQE